MFTFYTILLVLQLFLTGVLCQPCQEGSFIPNPKACGKYFICQHGSRVKMECNGGLHFKVSTGTCELPSFAGCSNTTTPATPVTPATPITTVKPVSASNSVTPATILTGTTIFKPITPVTDASSITRGTSATLLTGGSLITGSATIPTIPSVAKPNDFKIICYFTDWSAYRPGNGKFEPQNINPSLCTHIIYSFALLDPTTSLIKIGDPNTTINNAYYEKVLSFKNAGVKVTVSIGGWEDSSDGRYSAMVNDIFKRSAFIKHAVIFLKHYSFDGLDINWQFPLCWQSNCSAGPESDKSSFASFVSELRVALTPEYILSATVSAKQAIIEKAYDIPILSKNLNWISVMTYDFYTGYDTRTGHIAPLYKTSDNPSKILNTDYGLTYWQKNGADPAKLIVGIPLYGNSFLLQNGSVNGLNSPTFGPGVAGPFTDQAGMLAYYEICKMLPKYTVVTDNNNFTGPYAFSNTGPNYAQWISYDDETMVQVKANYVKTKNLGGVMVWALDLDDFNGSCGKGKYPLLRALKNALGPT